MKNKAKKFWDRQAGKYDKAEKQFDPVNRNVIIKTCHYLKSEYNVLDFGCATGTKTIVLADKVNHIHGLDFSDEMIRLASRKKDEGNIINVSFSKGTLPESGFEIASFDIIVSYAVIHLLEESQKVINKIHELLKPGGLFISTTACLNDRMDFKNRLVFSMTMFMRTMGFLPLHINMYRPEDVEKLIENQRFQIVESEKIADGITAIFIVARKQ